MEFNHIEEFNNSHIYFYTPSATAKELLYYPLVAGRFVCDENYLVKREAYDSILALYVISGSMTLKQGETTFKASSGELLLVDCYEKHEYYSSTFTKTLWVHFDGSNSRKWFELIKEKKGQKISPHHECAESIINIINGINSQIDEYEQSNLVYSLLCNISKSDDFSQKSIPESVALAKGYIKSNLGRDITVDEISSHVHLSASYFSKIFKEATGFSPYAYLLNQRIETAKKLLIQSHKSVELISSETGFGSVANFIYCFNQKMNMTPLKFRKIKF